MTEKEEVYELVQILEKKWTILWEMVDAASQTVLERRPEPSKWNTLQILFHLQKSEESTLQYILKKLSFSPNGLPEATFGSHMRLKLLQVVLWSPLKIKAPKGLSNVPEHPDIKNLRQLWEENNKGFGALIDQLSEKEMHWQLLKHPFIGRLDLKDTIKFMISHFDHHQRQIARLIDHS